MFLKSVLILIMLISSSFASQDRVGDFSIFGFLSNGIQGVQAQILDKYNASTQSFSMRTIVEVNGQQTSSSEEITANQIMTKELANEYIARCEEIGGTREQIQLMKKQWATCKLSAQSFEGQSYLSLLNIEQNPENGGFIWLGEFPIFGFGMIKIPNLVMILGDMNWGN